MHESERSKGNSEVQKWQGEVDCGDPDLAQHPVAGEEKARDGDGDSERITAITCTGLKRETR